MLGTSNLIATAAGVGVSLFVGYCFYFDYKRRSAPDYKAKILARRKAKAKNSDIEFPDLSDQAALQAFFYQQLHVGESLINEGKVKQGVANLGIAIMLTGQGRELLTILQQTLPPETYKLLVKELPKSRERIKKAYISQSGNAGPASMFASAASDTKNALDDLE